MNIQNKLKKYYKSKMNIIKICLVLKILQNNK